MSKDGLITLAEAQARLLALRSSLPISQMGLADSINHCLAEPLAAQRNQPAAALSAMDGYAVRWADMPGPWTVTGESMAGTPFSGSVGPKQAVRISTGALLPEAADTVIVQEDTARSGQQLALTGSGPENCGAHIRPVGSDFQKGAVLAQPGQRIDARLIALAAMAGHAKLPVRQMPNIALLNTGSELIEPGKALPSPAHIPASNGVMLQAMIRQQGFGCGTPIMVPDDLDAMKAAIGAQSGADIIVTSGGASVGDHDLIRPALQKLGASLDFWRIAMKPGKPVLLARLNQTIVLGLPGNPVSAFVTAYLLLLPLLRHLSGDPSPLPATRKAQLTRPLPPGGPRQEFLRAQIAGEKLVPFEQQDSAGLATLAKSDALIIRGIDAAPATTGEWADYYPI